MLDQNVYNLQLNYYIDISLNTIITQNTTIDVNRIKDKGLFFNVVK